MHEHRNPIWWTREYDWAWNRAKVAFKHEWERGKRDSRGKPPEIAPGVDDAALLAAGRLPSAARTYEELEDAFRFGYGAKAHYGSRYSHWDNQLEEELERDWRETYSVLDWLTYRSEIHRGWDYNERREIQSAA